MDASLADSNVTAPAGSVRRRSMRILAGTQAFPSPSAESGLRSPRKEVSPLLAVSLRRPPLNSTRKFCRIGITGLAGTALKRSPAILASDSDWIVNFMICFIVIYGLAFPKVLSYSRCLCPRRPPGRLSPALRQGSKPHWRDTGSKSLPRRGMSP